jgi:hypothetical protein
MSDDNGRKAEEKKAQADLQKQAMDNNAAAIADDRNPDNSLITGSPLAHLFAEQVIFTCGDCHLGSAGQNNRAGDFRSAGCSACHMPYSLGGRSGSADPNVNKTEPLNPDAIHTPERSHLRSHRWCRSGRTAARVRC